MRKLSARNQLKRLKRGFPNLLIEHQNKNSFSIVLKLQPSVFSKCYDVRITFNNTKRIAIYVINQKLEVAHNREKLPHVYSHKDQKLCLYQFDENKWEPSQSIASTIVPWTSEWLYYYEFWLSSGEWYGGGHNEYEQENININDSN